MNKNKFEKAIIEYSKKSGIGIHQLKHYLTDGRLIEILEIYDNLFDYDKGIEPEEMTEEEYIKWIKILLF